MVMISESLETLCTFKDNIRFVTLYVNCSFDSSDEKESEHFL